MSSRTSSIAVTEGLQLHVTEWGHPDGWPLTILHGGGHSAEQWRGVCERLPETIRVIVPDQRGHGSSDWSASEDYSCAAQVADLEVLLQRLDIERTALLGHSMGGLNALEFAGNHPDRTTALVLVDVGTETRDSGLERVGSQGDRAVKAPSPADIRGIARDEAMTELRGRHLGRDEGWLEAQLPREFNPIGNHRWRTRFDTRLIRFVPTYCGDAEHRRRLLRDCGASLLVLRGARSRIMTAESAAATAALGGGHVVEIPEAGHNVSIKNPEAVAQALLDFLTPLMREG